MIGPFLLASPVLNPNTTIIYPYFPKENWYDFYTGQLVKSYLDYGSVIPVTNNANQSIPLFIKGGSIIPIQPDEVSSINNIKKLHLYIAFNSDENGLLVA